MKYLFFFLLSLIYCADKPTVYFTKNITGEAIVNMFKKLNVNLSGKVGLKVHSGEPNGPYFLRPNFLQPIYEHTQGTFLECNVAYDSDRLTTEGHKTTLKTNGWLDNDRRFDIMDAEEDTYFEIPNHNKINITYAGKKLLDYDSCLVLSHFKGHAMGGFGGALKQLSIGFGSTKGKTWIHTAGQSTNHSELFPKKASQEDFTASMADAAWAISDYFKKKGGIAYISVLANISIDCDCAGLTAKAPEIKDIGIFASTDPVAIDQACLDMVKATNDTGTQAFLERVKDKKGENTIAAAVNLGVGKREYNLVDIDEDPEPTAEPTAEPTTDPKPSSSLYLRINLFLLLLLLFV